jgi:hypothetical protein
MLPRSGNTRIKRCWRGTNSVTTKKNDAILDALQLNYNQERLAQGAMVPLMQTFHKRFSVVTGFGLLVIVLAANAIITRRRLGVQVEGQLWLSHTRQVLFELAQTESFLKDAETGQRGFLYTGDPKYLAPYNLAVGQVEPSIDKVAQLTADNPRSTGSHSHAPQSGAVEDEGTRPNDRAVSVG